MSGLFFSERSVLPSFWLRNMMQSPKELVFLGFPLLWCLKCWFERLTLIKLATYDAVLCSDLSFGVWKNGVVGLQLCQEIWVWGSAFSIWHFRLQNYFPVLVSPVISRQCGLWLNALVLRILRRGLFVWRCMVGFYLGFRWSSETAVQPYPKVMWIVKRFCLSDCEVLVFEF